MIMIVYLWDKCLTGDETINRAYDKINKKDKQKQIQGGKEKVPQKSAEAKETREEIATIANLSHDTIDKIEFLESSLSLLIS